jgi:hypothetical protein
MRFGGGNYVNLRLQLPGMTFLRKKTSALVGLNGMHSSSRKKPNFGSRNSHLRGLQNHCAALFDHSPFHLLAVQIQAPVDELHIRSEANESFNTIHKRKEELNDKLRAHNK